MIHFSSKVSVIKYFNQESPSLTVLTCLLKIFWKLSETPACVFIAVGHSLTWQVRPWWAVSSGFSDTGLQPPSQRQCALLWDVLGVSHPPADCLGFCLKERSIGYCFPPNVITFSNTLWVSRNACMHIHTHVQCMTHNLNHGLSKSASGGTI